MLIPSLLSSAFKTQYALNTITVIYVSKHETRTVSTSLVITSAFNRFFVCFVNMRCVCRTCTIAGICARFA